MVYVYRKDDKEALENMIRRFNRKVMQSGVLRIARAKKYHEKPPTKVVLRQAAIIKKARRDAKVQKTYFGR
jgi:small subunit ribosomal protein S21